MGMVCEKMGEEGGWGKREGEGRGVVDVVVGNEGRGARVGVGRRGRGARRKGEERG